MLLAIDTATRLLSIALSDGQQVLAETSWHSANHHTVELAPHVQRITQQAGISTADLTALAVVTGPGSFTGLRIGMSFAKGMALAQQIPLVGVPTLDVVAAAQPILADQLCAVVQAGRGRITPAFYKADGVQWALTKPAEILRWDELTVSINRPTQFAGEIDEVGQKALAELASRHDYVILSGVGFNLRRAGFLAQLAYQKLASEESLPSAATLAPTYLT